MPYICMIRTDIDPGVLQVLDLWPNTSLRNSVYDPVGQTKYVDRLQNDTVTVASNVTTSERKGLAAYIIDNVAHGGTGNALTAAQANSMATAVIARLDAGSVLTAAGINTALQTVVAATEINANSSIGSVAGVLKICAGGEYVLPRGTAAASGGAFKGTAAGAFTAGQYRNTYAGLPLSASIGEGSLSQYTASTFTYGGSTGAALVVYADDGTLLS